MTPLLMRAFLSAPFSSVPTCYEFSQLAGVSTPSAPAPGWHRALLLLKGDTLICGVPLQAAISSLVLYCMNSEDLSQL